MPSLAGSVAPPACPDLLRLLHRSRPGGSTPAVPSGPGPRSRKLVWSGCLLGINCVPGGCVCSDLGGPHVVWGARRGRARLGGLLGTTLGHSALRRLWSLLSLMGAAAWAGGAEDDSSFLVQEPGVSARRLRAGLERPAQCSQPPRGLGSSDVSHSLGVQAPSMAGHTESPSAGMSASPRQSLWRWDAAAERVWIKGTARRSAIGLLLCGEAR